MWERIRSTLVLAVAFVFLTRYSWLAAVTLVGLVPLSLQVMPGLLANLFVLDRPVQIMHVSWLSFWCAATVMETLRVTTIHSIDRFDDYRLLVRRFRRAWQGASADGGVSRDDPYDWYRTRNGWIAFLLGATASLGMWFVIIDACVYCTSSDPSPTWTAIGVSSAPAVRATCWRYAIWGVLVGALVWGTVHGLVIALQERARWRVLRAPPAAAPTATTDAVASVTWFEWFDWLVGPGYFRRPHAGDSRQHLAPGHSGLLCFTVVFITWYGINYATALGNEPMPTEDSPYPALFNGLMSLLIVTYLLAGAAFFWDRFRVPVSLAILGAMMLLYGFFGTDHFYELNPAPPRAIVQQPPTLEQVFDRWEFPTGKDGKRTLVVVDASGGGIQASAWAAQVLTGLHEVYGEPFSRAVGLISGVSGGSVGAMYYVAHRAEIDSGFDRRHPSASVLPGQAVQQIRELSRSSALEATTWGFAYPDSMRAAFPPVVGRNIDRGWAIEQVWRQRLTASDVPSRGDLRLSDLTQAVAQRQLPIVVFNSTLVETGQRFMIAPVLSPRGTNPEEQAAAVEFLREFPDAHPWISTAARLSATFPYITPAARSDAVKSSSPVSVYHVVDGAYTDNEGAVTSVDWLNRLVTYYGRDDKLLDRPFDRVVLIRIQAFPAGHNRRKVKAPSTLSGWRAALTGPLDAMMQVRSASQAERGDLEVGLLTRATTARIEAARERFAAEFKQAQAMIDVLQDDASQAAAPPSDVSAPDSEDPADRIRRQAETADQLRFAELRRDLTLRQQRQIDELEIVQVLLDFHAPGESRIPLSWKLTESQKQNIDRAWQVVLNDLHPNQPLRKLDRYFERAAGPVVSVGTAAAKSDSAPGETR